MKVIRKTTFLIREMDCPSEEQMIRMKLATMDTIRQLRFDTSERRLEVYHSGDPAPIAAQLATLDLGASEVSTSDAELPTEPVDEARQRKMLWWALSINFGLFIVEMLFGWISASMGLVADSLDMLADSIVYGLSLMAVGAVIATKKRVAKVSGYFQMTLAVLGFSEVIRRFLSSSETPLFQWMIIISILALIGNVISLWIINKVRSGEVHMQASAIFTSNDIIVNGGVILAGILVYALGNKWPDLIVGGIVFTFVMRGALKILSLSR